MRLTTSELETLFLTQETERVERKQSVRDGDRICQAICAFANDLSDSRLQV